MKTVGLLFNFLVAFEANQGVTLIDTIKQLFGQIDLLFYLKTFLFKNKRGIAPFLVTSRVVFLFTVLITDAVQCGIFNAISKKNFCYSPFIKRMIAILSGFGWTIKVTTFLLLFMR